MKRIRRRTRNRIIGVVSTLSVLVLGVIMITVFSKAEYDEYKAFVGQATNYGIVAETFGHGGSDIETNFAVIDYTSGGQPTGNTIADDKAAYAGTIMFKTISGGLNTHSKAEIYTTQDVIDSYTGKVQGQGAEFKAVSGSAIEATVKNMIAATKSHAQSVIDRDTDDVLWVAPAKVNKPEEVENPGDAPEAPAVVEKPGQEPEEPGEGPDENDEKYANDEDHSLYNADVLAFNEKVEAYNAYEEQVKAYEDYKKALKEYEEDSLAKYNKKLSKYNKYLKKKKQYDDYAGELDKFQTKVNSATGVAKDQAGNYCVIDARGINSDVVYVNVDDMYEAFGRGLQSSDSDKIRIFANEKQTIVLNATGEGDYTIPNYKFNDVQEGPAGEDTAKQIIWNFANSTGTITIATSTRATIVAPQASVNVNATSEGWLIAKSVTAGAEWHMLSREDITPPDVPVRTPKPTKTPKTTMTPPPTTSPESLVYEFPFEVTKEFVGDWPEGAEFKFDISVDDASNGYIDTSDLHSVTLTKTEPTQSMGSVKFDLTNFKGWDSGDYPGYQYYPYKFTITEDATYRPKDTKGVNYDAIEYDTTPRHIKIFVNVKHDASGKVVDYKIQPREALHVDGATCFEDGEECYERTEPTKFINRLKSVPPTPSYDIDVAKVCDGAWPDGAKFKIDLSFDEEESYAGTACVDTSGLSDSVTLTKDEPSLSMGTVRFDLSKFSGLPSVDDENTGFTGYTGKYVRGKYRDLVYYDQYMFTVSEDSTYRPEDSEESGVDYDAIEYDTTPRHIKLWLNVEVDHETGDILDSWIEPREAIGDADCNERNGATTFTNKVPPVVEHPIEVTKAFEGTWPEGAEFKFDISFDEEKSDGSLKCIDYTGLDSVCIKDDTENHTQSMGTVKFDLSKFKGGISDEYTNKEYKGKLRGNVYCCQYMFTVKEDATYKPVSGVEYDTTPRHIKLWLNVEKDASGKIVDYWVQPRVALHKEDSDGKCAGEKCDPLEGAVKFTNKIITVTPPPSDSPTPTPTPVVSNSPTPTPTPEVTPTPTPEVTPTPTPVVTNSPTPTPTPEVTPTPTPTSTPEVTPTPTPVVTNPPTTPPNVPVVTPTPTETPATAAPTETPLIVLNNTVPLAQASPTPTPDAELPPQDVPLSNINAPTTPKEKTETIVEKIPLASTVPETGDSMNPMIPIAGMGISLLLIVVIAVIRKKKML